MGFDIGDSLFAGRLHGMIEKRKAEIVASVVSSSGVGDFAAYQRLVGHLAAFDEVFGMFETVAGRIDEEGKKR